MRRTMQPNGDHARVAAQFADGSRAVLTYEYGEFAISAPPDTTAADFAARISGHGEASPSDKALLVRMKVHLVAHKQR